MALTEGRLEFVCTGEWLDGSASADEAETRFPIGSVAGTGDRDGEVSP